jgi:hypothetical protein
MGSLLGFWGLRVPPNKKVTVDVDENRMEMVHLGKIALGPKPGTAPHCVLISDAEHDDIALCTLDRSERQTSVEFVITQRTVLHHTGDSDVYFSGFKSYDGDGDEEEEAGANGLPAANGHIKVRAASSQPSAMHTVQRTVR